MATLPNNKMTYLADRSWLDAHVSDSKISGKERLYGALAKTQMDNPVYLRSRISIIPFAMLRGVRMG